MTVSTTNASKSTVAAAVVHAGAQGRWHEELCRIRVRSLRQLVNGQGTALKGNSLPSKGGVYCFWWTGDMGLLRDGCNRYVEVVGPAKRPVLLHFDDEWLGLATELPIPLYVGKTADSLAKRARGHLMLNRARLTPQFEGHRKQKRPSTSCQARAGVEHLFPSLADTRALVLDNLGLSWVELHGDEHAANRFYLENLAIGMMRPPLNIDVER